MQRDIKDVQGQLKETKEEILEELRKNSLRLGQITEYFTKRDIENGEEHFFEGIVKGEIIKEKQGNCGFGYDPIFCPEGYTETFAELGNEIKNKISHRAKAVEKLCAYLTHKQ